MNFMINSCTINQPIFNELKLHALTSCIAQINCFSSVTDAANLLTTIYQFSYSMEYYALELQLFGHVAS